MKKLPRYRVRRNPKGRAALKDSSSVVLSFAATMLLAWSALPEVVQKEILLSLGVSPLRLAVTSFAITVAATFLAKHTRVERVDRPQPPPQEEGDGPA